MVNIEQLSQFVQQPETHRRLLDGYSGAYSLGIGRQAGEFVLVLQLQGDAHPNLPSRVSVGGESVPLLVQNGFTAPSALAW